MQRAYALVDWAAVLSLGVRAMTKPFVDVFDYTCILSCLERMKKVNAFFTCLHACN